MLYAIDLWMYGFSLALAVVMLLPGAAGARARTGRIGRLGGRAGGRLGKVGGHQPARLGKVGGHQPAHPARPAGRSVHSAGIGRLELPRYSLLHPIALPGFLGGFGAFGFIARGLELDGLAAPIVGVIGGLLLSFLIFKLFVRVILAGEGGDAPGPESAIGALATVTTTIPVGGLGAVAYEAAGRRQTVPARAANAQSLSRGAEVVILEFERHVALVGDFEDHPFAV